MFIDARGVASNSEISADLCIVGAGAAGITLARSLAGDGVNVCLLESGDLAFRWDTQSLYDGSNVGLPYFDLDVCQVRYFGGNTNGWGGWCRPLDPIDLEPRPWLGLGGWPLSSDELAPYYRRAYEICQLPTADFDASSWCARLGNDRRARLLPFDPAKLVPSVYQFSPPTRFGRVYRDAIAAAGTVRCFVNANVLKLKTTCDARSVKHVEVGTLAGNRFRVAARLFVLAAGGIENARLLLLSNDVIGAGLGNGNDLVGRHFMEHPHTKRVLLANRRRAPVALYGLRFHDRGVSVRLDLPPELQEREELLHYSANIHPIYFGQRIRGVAVVPQARAVAVAVAPRRPLCAVSSLWPQRPVVRPDLRHRAALRSGDGRGVPATPPAQRLDLGLCARKQVGAGAQSPEPRHLAARARRLWVEPRSARSGACCRSTAAPCCAARRSSRTS